MAKAVKTAKATATAKAAPKTPSSQEGRVFVLKCKKCDFTKTRKYRSDILGWERDHLKEKPGHSVEIMTANEEATAKKAVVKKPVVKKAAASTKTKKEAK